MKQKIKQSEVNVSIYLHSQNNNKKSRQIFNVKEEAQARKKRE